MAGPRIPDRATRAPEHHTIQNLNRPQSLGLLQDRPVGPNDLGAVDGVRGGPDVLLKQIDDLIKRFMSAMRPEPGQEEGSAASAESSPTGDVGGSQSEQQSLLEGILMLLQQLAQQNPQALQQLLGNNPEFAQMLGSQIGALADSGMGSGVTV